MTRKSEAPARRVVTTVDPIRLAEIEAAAAADGVSVSAWVRRAIVAALPAAPRLPRPGVATTD